MDAQRWCASIESLEKHCNVTVRYVHFRTTILTACLAKLVRRHISAPLAHLLFCTTDLATHTESLSRMNNVNHRTRTDLLEFTQVLASIASVRIGVIDALGAEVV